MVQIVYDVHAHTTYSDGSDIEEMAKAAADAGLAGIDFSDHCVPYRDPFGRRDRYDLVETYEQRREDIRGLSADVAVFDTAEVNYDPNYETAIRKFLNQAEFTYTIGSVHYAGDCDLNGPSELAHAPDETKRVAVKTYVDWQVRLIESELFDVIAHIDLPQRSTVLRDIIEPEDYRRLADALADSKTIPEINAGRLDREYGTVHPDPSFLEVFWEAGVPFFFGTDSHSPDQIQERVRRLEPVLEMNAIEVADFP